MRRSTKCNSSSEEKKPALFLSSEKSKFTFSNHISNHVRLLTQRKWRNLKFLATNVIAALPPLGVLKLPPLLSLREVDLC